MGMYTRFKLDATVGASTPSAVLDVLHWLVGPRECSHGELPEHALFRCQRWDSIGHGAMSYWETPPPAPTLIADADGGWRLSFECALRNYDDEIDQFCAWLGPYLTTAPGTVIGLTESEHERYGGRPTLLVAQVGSISTVQGAIDIDPPALRRWGD